MQSRLDVPDDSGDVLDAGSADDLGGGDDNLQNLSKEPSREGHILGRDVRAGVRARHEVLGE